MTTLFSTRDADNDEVRAALITAASYHRHSQFDHSVRWLRHAAQLAAQNGQITRSRDLQTAARQLVELVEAPTRRGMAQPLPTTRSGDVCANEMGSPLSSIAATHRSPYPHEGAGGPDDPAQRLRLDSPTEVNRPIHTMRTPQARTGCVADESADHAPRSQQPKSRKETQPKSRALEPPSLLRNATVLAPATVAQSANAQLAATHPDDAPDSALVDAPPVRDTHHNVDFHIVEEATRSSNPGHGSAAQPGGFRRSSLSADADPQAAIDDPDDDATTLTTLAPIRVAVIEAVDGSARLISVRGANSAPAGAIQGLLIPVNADERARLRELLRRSDE